MIVFPYIHVYHYYSMANKTSKETHSLSYHFIFTHPSKTIQIQSNGHPSSSSMSELSHILTFKDTLELDYKIHSYFFDMIALVSISSPL